MVKDDVGHKSLLEPWRVRYLGSKVSISLEFLYQVDND